jgi:hypothetical protein
MQTKRYIEVQKDKRSTGEAELQATENTNISLQKNWISTTCRQKQENVNRVI